MAFFIHIVSVSEVPITLPAIICAVPTAEKDITNLSGS